MLKIKYIKKIYNFLFIQVIMVMQYLLKNKCTQIKSSILNSFSSETSI